jgi:hypothetical protein
MNDKNEGSTPRLGSASIFISFNDEDGFIVTHGTDATILAHKPPERCKSGDWDQLWKTIRNVVLPLPE